MDRSPKVVQLQSTFQKDEYLKFFSGEVNLPGEIWIDPQKWYNSNLPSKKMNTSNFFFWGGKSTRGDMDRSPKMVQLQSTFQKDEYIKFFFWGGKSTRGDMDRSPKVVQLQSTFQKDEYIKFFFWGGKSTRGD